jgi:hypothetical protein
MNEHGFGNLAPLAIMAFFVVTALWKRMTRAGKPAASPTAPQPVYPRLPMDPDQPQAQPPRRRLAAPVATRPVMPPALPSTARVSAIVPSMAETLPAEAAAAFPTLDLSLPDTPGIPSRTARRRVRTLGGGPRIGSPGWAANAVLASEIIGSPVSLRSGATLGVPHAF